jgi:hypothetical protein
MDAVPGVTDGGANKATGNGNLVQCGERLRREHAVRCRGAHEAAGVDQAHNQNKLTGETQG